MERNADRKRAAIPCLSPLGRTLLPGAKEPVPFQFRSDYVLQQRHQTQDKSRRTDFEFFRQQVHHYDRIKSENTSDPSSGTGVFDKGTHACQERSQRGLVE